MSEGLDLYVSNLGTGDAIFDWNKAASSLSSNIALAAGMRQVRRAENEQFKKSAEDTLNTDPELTNTTLQTFTVNAASSGRNKINELYNMMKNGQISRTQYKAALANIDDYWKTTADYIKGLDSRYAESLKRREEDVNSEIELGTIDYFSRLNDINGKALSFSDDGKIALAVFGDKDTPVGFQDIKSLNNLMNTRYDKVKMFDIIDAGTKNWDKNEQRYNVTDPTKLDPLFGQQKNALIASIITSDRDAASVLVDWGGGTYAPYFSDADKQAALDKLKVTNPNATEDNLILMTADQNGYVKPAGLTKTQLEKSREIADAAIMSRFSRQVEYPPGYGSGGRGGQLTEMQKVKLGQKEEFDSNFWELTYNSFNNLSKEKNRNYWAGRLTGAMGGDFIVRPNPEGNGYVVDNKNGTMLIGPDRAIKHPKGVWSLIGGADTGWESRYNNSGLKRKKSPKGSANQVIQSSVNYGNL